METYIQGIKINNYGAYDEDEIKEYIRMAKEKISGAIVEITLKPSKDGKVEIEYIVLHRKFERIRRITGYLVGTTDRWNNAKQQEERDRVKHEVPN